MKFNYNQKFNGKVYYSGPYWDEKEINAEYVCNERDCQRKFQVRDPNSNAN